MFREAISFFQREIKLQTNHFSIFVKKYRALSSTFFLALLVVEERC